MQVTLTLREWQKQPLRLLVFDNLEEPKILSEWLPKLNGLRILVTARRSQWSVDLGVDVHLLDTLPRPDSLALLRKLAPRLKGTSDADLDMLAEMGDLPQALDLEQRALAMYQKFLPPEHPDIKNALSWVAEIERRMNSGKS